MKSTMENTMEMVSGTMKIVPKELPNWYGIEGIGFVWHNEWADPEIEYNGRRCSCFIVEDTMWERWIHDDYDNFVPERETDFEGFEKYMLDNADDVRELCELAMFGEEM